MKAFTYMIKSILQKKIMLIFMVITLLVLLFIVQGYRQQEIDYLDIHSRRIDMQQQTLVLVKLYQEKGEIEKILADNYAPESIDDARDLSLYVYSVGNEIKETQSTEEINRLYWKNSLLTWMVVSTYNDYWQKFPDQRLNPEVYYGDDYSDVLKTLSFPKMAKDFTYGNSAAYSAGPMALAMYYEQLYKLKLASRTQYSTTPFLFLFNSSKTGIGILFAFLGVFLGNGFYSYLLDKGIMKNLVVAQESRCKLFNRTFIALFVGLLLFLLLLFILTLAYLYLTTGEVDAQHPICLNESWLRSWKYDELTYDLSKFGRETSYIGPVVIKLPNVTQGNIHTFTFEPLWKVFLRLLPVMLSILVAGLCLGIFTTLLFRNQLYGKALMIALVVMLLGLPAVVPSIKGTVLDLMSVVRIPQMVAGETKITLQKLYVSYGGAAMAFYAITAWVFQRFEKF